MEFRSPPESVPTSPVPLTLSIWCGLAFTAMGCQPATVATSRVDGAVPSNSADASTAVSPCAPPANIDEPKGRLSDTGCMDPSNPTRMAAAVLTYDVNSPLWSDGADKSRGFVLPANKKIHVKNCAKEPDLCRVGPEDDGKWIFPVGTVMVKSFSFDGKLVETRLFVRSDEATWVGYGYEWNEAQTEATIVPRAGDTVTFNTGTRSIDWHYPSREDCMSCHFVTAGFTLGPETQQMNLAGAGSAENQITALARKGVFDEAPAQPYQAPLVAPYAGSWGQPPPTATVEQRARSYLHANCGFCHRPDGNFPNFDVRYGISLDRTATCNVDPQRGTLGVDGAMILKPGDAAGSTLWSRMKTLGIKERMPNIASAVVDTDGLKVVGDWIASLTACP